MPITPATLEVEARDHSPRPAWAKLARPYLKNKIKTKGLRASGMAQVVECLPSKCEAL
jgi:hypothetical protein